MPGQAPRALARNSCCPWRGERLTLVAVSLVALGCAEAAPRPPGQIVVHDSAAVRIVESSGATWSAGVRWRVGIEPSVEIGSAEGAAGYTFGFVSGARRLGDGRIVVLDAMLGVLSEYSAEGAFLRQWARKGEGPGELRAPLDLLWLPGDTLMVADRPHTSLFGPDGRYARRVTLPLAEWAYLGVGDGLPAWPSMRQLLGRLPDGTYVGQLAGRVARTTGKTREEVALVRIAEDGAGDTIVVLPGTHHEVVIEGGAHRLRPDHFPSRLSATIQEASILASDGSTFGFDQYAPDGRLLQRARLLEARTAVDVHLKASWRKYRAQSWTQSPEPGVEAGRLRRLFEATPYPDSLPAVYEMRVDRGGSVWLEGYPEGDWDQPSRTHYVFDEAGKFLGVVDLPPGLRVLDIGTDYILGVWRDGNDVDFVRLYELSRGP